MTSGAKYYFSEYHTVFCSIDIDDLWGEDTLPYTGRMMIPLLIPGLEGAFPGGATPRVPGAQGAAVAASDGSIHGVSSPWGLSCGRGGSGGGA